MGEFAFAGEHDKKDDWDDGSRPKSEPGKTSNSSLQPRRIKLRNAPGFRAVLRAVVDHVELRDMMANQLHSGEQVGTSKREAQLADKVFSLWFQVELKLLRNGPYSLVMETYFEKAIYKYVEAVGTLKSIEHMPPEMLTERQAVDKSQVLVDLANAAAEIKKYSDAKAILLER